MATDVVLLITSVSYLDLICRGEKLKHDIISMRAKTSSIRLHDTLFEYKLFDRCLTGVAHCISMV